MTISAGPLKAYDLTLPTVFAHAIRWYAFGDLERVAALLTRHVPALGRKRGHGWGTVDRWTVETCDVDRSIERTDPSTAAKVLMRRMPLEAGFAGRQTLQAIRPPYFHVSRRVPSTEPSL